MPTKLISSAITFAVLATSAQAQPSEVVADSRWQWTGVGVTDDHTIFVNYPRWSDRMEYSVAKLDKHGHPHPFPNAEWNSWQPGDPVTDQQFVAVQSVVVDDAGTLWVLDTGNPFFSGVVEGAPRLFKFDPDSGEQLRTYQFDQDAANANSYLNDVRFDLEHGFAYLTDSNEGGLVVLNLETGDARRVLAAHPSTFAEPIEIVIGGNAWMMNGVTPEIHSDGIAYDPSRDILYYQALTGATLYQLPAAALRDESLNDNEIASSIKVASTHFPVDGLIADDRGRVYLSNLQDGAVDRFDPTRPDESLERLAHDGTIIWPDSFSLTADGWLYFTSAQIHLGDNPHTPYRIHRIQIGVQHAD